MSRPPLFPAVSAAGIIQDPNTQQRIIPASVRADGSVRKERRIKPGFTPQEDVTRFRSSRQLAAANSRRIVPGSGIPGAAGPSTHISIPSSASAGSSASAALSKAAKKNAKRKAARAAGGGGSGAAGDRTFDDEDGDEDGEEEDVPDAWDEEEPASSAGRPQAASASKGSAPEAAEPSKPEPAQASSSRGTESASAVVPPAAEAESGGAEEASSGAAVDPAKRAKALAKKIRAAETLRERAHSGETLLPEQQAKVDSIDALTAELASLEIKD
ncbi:hypothetical protein OC834_003901 [Tilletia horrida]|nr:hypothetical protein OC834_003901 [Tilletia horrida]